MFTHLKPREPLHSTENNNNSAQINNLKYKKIVKGRSALCDSF